MIVYEIYKRRRKIVLCSFEVYMLLLIFWFRCLEFIVFFIVLGLCNVYVVLEIL